MRADRLLSLLLHLQAGGRTTAEALAERLEVSVRTIYRDVEALSAAGIPVFAESGPGGGFQLLDGYRTPLSGLSPDEARALLTLGVPAPLHDLGLARSATQARLKLSTVIPASESEQRFHLDAPAWFRPVEEVPLLPEIARATREELSLKITYAPANRGSFTRKLDPLGLVNKAGHWYLVASDGSRTHAYRVSRIRKAAVLERFDRPSGFDLVDFWSEWSKDFEATRPRLPVEMRVHPSLLKDLPSIFGESVQSAIKDAPAGDAEGWVPLTLSFESEEAAVMRLLGLGPEVEVLKPAKVRKALVERARATLLFYVIRP